MTTITTKWTLEDYHHAISTGLLDDRNVELIKGDVVETAPERLHIWQSCSTFFSYRAGRSQFYHQEVKNNCIEIPQEFSQKRFIPTKENNDRNPYGEALEVAL